MDRIKRRPWGDRALTALDNQLSLDRKTIVLDAFCGSGKTLVLMDLANELYRRDIIDRVLIFTPRVNLCRQYELDWNRFRTLYGGRVLGRVCHRDNQGPIEHPDMFGAPQHGVVTTYASLTSDPRLWVDYCRTHRVALILDEAQILGADSEEISGSGTEAARVVAELCDLARFVEIATGTDQRSDSRRLLHCNYTEPDPDGRIKLLPDVRATYAEGVTHKYLRQIDVDFRHGEAILKYLDNEEEEPITLATLTRGLKKVLRQPPIWEPIVDEAAQEIIAVRATREPHFNRFKALFGATDQLHARKILGYLNSRYPDHKWCLAICDEDSSLRTLEGFKRDTSAGMVTVGMAYIGYDNPWITLVCCLSPNRHLGWLDQFAFRGGRVVAEIPYELQRLRVIGPVDPFFKLWADHRIRDCNRGFRERQEGDPTGQPPPPQRTCYVKDAQITGAEVMSYQRDCDLDVLEFARFNEFVRKYNLRGVPHPDRVRLFRDMQRNGPPGGEPEEADPLPVTESIEETDSDLIHSLRAEIHGITNRIDAAMMARDPSITWGWAATQANDHFGIGSIKEASSGRCREVLRWLNEYLLPMVNRDAAG